MANSEWASQLITIMVPVPRHCSPKRALPASSIALNNLPQLPASAHYAVVVHLFTLFKFLHPPARTKIPLSSALRLPLAALRQLRGRHFAICADG